MKITEEAVPDLRPKTVNDTVRKRDLRVGNAVSISVVKCWDKKRNLHHVGCMSADCQACLTDKFPRCFEGSPITKPRKETLHSDPKRTKIVNYYIGHKYCVTIGEENSRVRLQKMVGVSWPVFRNKVDIQFAGCMQKEEQRLDVSSTSWKSKVYTCRWIRHKHWNQLRWWNKLIRWCRHRPVLVGRKLSCPYCSENMLRVALLIFKNFSNIRQELNFRMN